MQEVLLEILLCWYISCLKRYLFFLQVAEIFVKAFPNAEDIRVPLRDKYHGLQQRLRHSSVKGNGHPSSGNTKQIFSFTLLINCDNTFFRTLCETIIIAFSYTALKEFCGKFCIFFLMCLHQTENITTCKLMVFLHVMTLSVCISEWL